MRNTCVSVYSSHYSKIDVILGVFLSIVDRSSYHLESRYRVGSPKLRFCVKFLRKVENDSIYLLASCSMAAPSKVLDILKRMF